MDHNEAGDLYTTRPQGVTSSSNAETQYRMDSMQFKSKRTKLSTTTHYTLSRSINVNLEGHRKLFQDGVAEVYIRGILGGLEASSPRKMLF